MCISTGCLPTPGELCQICVYIIALGQLKEKNRRRFEPQKNTQQKENRQQARIKGVSYATQWLHQQSTLAYVWQFSLSVALWHRMEIPLNRDGNNFCRISWAIVTFCWTLHDDVVFVGTPDMFCFPSFIVCISLQQWHTSSPDIQTLPYTLSCMDFEFATFDNNSRGPFLLAWQLQIVGKKLMTFEEKKQKKMKCRLEWKWFKNFIVILC